MPAPLLISRRDVGDVAILELTGHLVAEDGTRLLRDTVKAAVALGTHAFLLDLEDLSYMDSAGVGTLVHIYRHVTARGGQIKLLHPSLCARRVLGISRLTAVFEVFDTENEALLNLAGAHH